MAKHVVLDADPRIPQRPEAEPLGVAEVHPSNTTEVEQLIGNCAGLTLAAE